VSVERAFGVIEYLARRGPSSLRGIARELELPVSSVHRLLHSLEREHAVERTRNDEWSVGRRILELAGAQLERLELPAAARPVLEQLSGGTGQTAFLAVRSGAEVVYLDKVQTSAQVQLYVERGARRPIHSTALGKAMLAFVAEPVREDVLRGASLIAITEHTITEPAVLRDQLVIVRERGYATDRDEAALGICCLAAPVLDHLGYVAGAVSIAGTDHRLRSEAADLVQAITGAAAQISQRLGHVGTSPSH
jgi:IclR family transcriptional regulator, KDG regulon repressor